jgi:Zn-dependent metalloprotease
MAALQSLTADGLKVEGVLYSAEGTIRTLRGELSESLGSGFTDLDPTEVARTFLVRHHASLGLPAEGSDFQHRQTRKTLMGTTVRFQRTYQGVPLTPGDVVVHLDSDGKVRWVSNETSAKPLPREVHFSLGTDGAISAALSHLQAKGALRAAPRAREVLSTRFQKARPVTEVLIASNSPLGDWLYEIDGEGKVLSRTNLLKFAHGRVFLPNPVVAVKNPGLKDQGDSASAIPAEAYTEVELLGLDDSATLSGQYASTAPASNRAQSSDGNFVYDRSDKRFEEVMVYYHLDYAQRFFQSLGIDNANNRVQEVDPHAGSEDNSYYSPATKQLSFGDGGVDDAEDAEIVWHEYGHSTQDDQVPGWGSGGDSGAMGEAFGDYLGAAISERFDTFQTACVGDWDGVAYSDANPPCLRRMDSTKHYPEDLAGEVHDDGEIWSAALWQIHTAMGSGEDAVRLVLAHHFLLPSSATMPEAAEALLQADQQLYSGKYSSIIKGVMAARGILKSTGTFEVTLRDEDGGAAGGEVTLTNSLGTLKLRVPVVTGTLRQLIAPGTYQMEVFSFGFEAPPPRSIELVEDGTVSENYQLVRSPGAEISGVVKNAAGEGIPASVRLAGIPVAPVVANNEGAFTIQVPGGSYDLMFSAFGYGLKTLKGVSIPGDSLNVVLEAVPAVLLVDDDAGQKYEAQFKESLDALGIDFLMVPVQGIRRATDLLSHEMVIWNTGNRSSNILAGPLEGILKDYLGAGGHLLVSGQDVGYGLQNRAFMAEVLGAKFVKDSSSSKQVEGSGLAFAIDQKWPDVLEATEGASLWLNYQSGEGAAVVHDYTAGRVIYLGFGIEGVSDLSSRNALLEACFRASDPASAHRRSLSFDHFRR